MHRVLPTLLGGLLLLLFGCDRSGSDYTIATENPAGWREAQPLTIDSTTLFAEIAITPTEQQMGLMHRENLGEDNGMIFIYGQPRQMTFWMKNTLIPLDIGFFSQTGELLQVARMYPRDRDTTASDSDQVCFALEMNQGWFRSKGIKPGAQLDLGTLRQALAARGVDPKEYGL